MFAPGVGGSLRGRVDTTLLLGGVTARPLPKLAPQANIRYESRDDKTPVFNYDPSAAGYAGLKPAVFHEDIERQIGSKLRVADGVSSDRWHGFR